MIPDRMKPHDALFCKSENDTVSLIKLKRPIVFQSPMEFMRMKPWVKRIIPEHLFFLFCEELDFERQAAIFSFEFRGIIDPHITAYPSMCGAISPYLR